MLGVARELRTAGCEVMIPQIAEKMELSGDYRVETYKTWFADPNDYHKKTALIKDHFQKVIDADAVLILNYEKKGVAGYVGGNCLMEMTVAFLHQKPMYVLHSVSDQCALKEEVMALFPTFLNGNLSILISNVRQNDIDLTRSRARS